MQENMPVADLPLPGRVRRALLRAGYERLGQLRPLLDERVGGGESALLEIRDLGAEGWALIRGVVALLDGTLPPSAAGEAPRPSTQQVAAIKAATPGYGASVTWLEEMVVQAYQAGYRVGYAAAQRAP